MTMLHAFSAIASEQANPTKRTLARANQLLYFMATNPNAIVRFYAPRHSIEWQYPQHMFNSQASGSISSGGWTESTFSQHPRSKNHQANTTRIRPSTAAYASTCRQYYSGRYTKQLYQASTFKGNGNEILLASRPKEQQVFQGILPTRSRKHGRLPIQSAYRSNAHACDTILHAYEQLSKNIT